MDQYKETPQRYGVRRLKYAYGVHNLREKAAILSKQGVRVRVQLPSPPPS